MNKPKKPKKKVDKSTWKKNRYAGERSFKELAPYASTHASRTHPED